MLWRVAAGQLGAGRLGPPRVHWWGVGWLSCLGIALGLPPPAFVSYYSLDVVCVPRAQRQVETLHASAEE